MRGMGKVGRLERTRLATGLKDLDDGQLDTSKWSEIPKWSSAVSYLQLARTGRPEAVARRERRDRWKPQHSHGSQALSERERERESLIPSDRQPYG